MSPEVLHDNAEIFEFFNPNRSLHFYSIGDLDPFFRPRSTYYGLREQGALRAVILLYQGQVTTLLALGDDLSPLHDLLNALLPELPERVYAHLTPGLEATLEQKYRLQPAGLFSKMQLVDTTALQTVASDDVIRLQPGTDEDAVREFLDDAYPGNWFDPRMLATGHYYGLREDDNLIGVSGVHLFSEDYSVAAIGNIAVAAPWRGRGLGEKLVGHLCRELLKGVEFIGLNVKVDNRAARAVYDRLGFKTTHHYGEFFAGV